MDTLLGVLEWIVLALAVALILAGLQFIRQKASVKTGVTHAVIFSNLCYLLSTVAVWVGDYSPFHLLWLFPASWIAGFFALVPPFSYVVNSLAKLYGPIVAIGVKGERRKSGDLKADFDDHVSPYLTSLGLENVGTEGTANQLKMARAISGYVTVMGWAETVFKRLIYALLVLVYLWVTYWLGTYLIWKGFGWFIESYDFENLVIVAAGVFCLSFLFVNGKEMLGNLLTLVQTYQSESLKNAEPKRASLDSEDN